VALCGGVFALSITFFKDIAPTPTGTIWLLLAWISFACSLLATLVSFLFSQDAWRRQRDILDTIYANKSGANALNWQSSLTAVLKWISIGGFVSGVIFLSLFAYFNLGVTT
jgi:hypothetical protein